MSQHIVQHPVVSISFLLSFSFNNHYQTSVNVQNEYRHKQPFSDSRAKLKTINYYFHSPLTSLLKAIKRYNQHEELKAINLKPQNKQTNKQKLCSI
jgi:hypothetical protein